MGKINRTFMYRMNRLLDRNHSIPHFSCLHQQTIDHTHMNFMPIGNKLNSYQKCPVALLMVNKAQNIVVT